MTTFAGFPSGKNPYVPIPEVFFTELLPEIEDQIELKVTLHLFWLLAQKPGKNPRYVSNHELQADHILLRSLKRRGDPRSPGERLRQGLEQAVARGTLLKIILTYASVESNGDLLELYFFNTARSRKVVAELQGGEIVPVRLLTAQEEQVTSANEKIVVAGGYATNKGYNREAVQAVESEPVTRNHQVQIERPNIFVLYEQNIGLLSPLIAEELKDAADQYPAEWIEAAFREAVQHNKRKWSYIRAILRRWETEGRQQWKA